MKICPIVFKNNSLSNKGQLSNYNLQKGHASLDYQNQSDVFVRLAIASTRDQKIEHELKNMYLI